jgi:hypothetical protein
MQNSQSTGSFETGAGFISGSILATCFDMVNLLSEVKVLEYYFWGCFA